MPYECSDCGKVHEELPRFFLRRVPETIAGELIAAETDRKSMCRTKTQFFVHCEIEVPAVDARDTPLGFICWVEIKRKDYERLMTFRETEDTAPVFSRLISGTLANPIAGVADSFGTAVKIEIVKGDPTPYVKWVAKGSALADRIKAGATALFWHEAASLLR